MRLVEPRGKSVNSNVINLNTRQIVSGEHRSIDRVTDAIIAMSANAIVWSIPTATIQIPFAIAGGPLRQVEAPMPHLIGGVVRTPSNGIEMHVVAVKRRGKPVDSTPIFHAPIMNVDHDGRLDLPQDQPHPGTSISSVSAWSDLMNSLPKIAVKHPRTIRLTDLKPGAEVSSYHHFRFWRELAASKSQSFPNWSLVERKQTFGSWVHELESRLL